MHNDETSTVLIEPQEAHKAEHSLRALLRASEYVSEISSLFERAGKEYAQARSISSLPSFEERAYAEAAQELEHFRSGIRSLSEGHPLKMVEWNTMQNLGGSIPNIQKLLELAANPPVTSPLQAATVLIAQEVHARFKEEFRVVQKVMSNHQAVESLLSYHDEMQCRKYDRVRGNGVPHNNPAVALHVGEVVGGWEKAPIQEL